jgi:hypothetical protein
VVNEPREIIWGLVDLDIVLCRVRSESYCAAEAEVVYCAPLHLSLIIYINFPYIIFAIIIHPIPSPAECSLIHAANLAGDGGACVFTMSAEGVTCAGGAGGGLNAGATEVGCVP